MTRKKFITCFLEILKDEVIKMLLIVFGIKILLLILDEIVYGGNSSNKWDFLAICITLILVIFPQLFIKFRSSNKKEE